MAEPKPEGAFSRLGSGPAPTARRAHTLLEFATAASAAVVPVMLGVVLLVAALRPGDAGPSALADRHLSARHVAALRTFETAIVARTAAAPLALTAGEVLAGVPACRRAWSGGDALRDGLASAGWRPPRDAPADRIAAQLATLDASLLAFGARANARVDHPVGIDPLRWFAAAGRSVAEPPLAAEGGEAPGRSPRIGCADLAAALATLLRADAAALDALAWRASAGAAVVARWQPDQEAAIAAQTVLRRNPWSGLPGCVFLGRRDGAAPSHFVVGARAAQRQACASPDVWGTLVAATTGHPGSTASAPPQPLAGEPGLADPVDDSRWSVPPSMQAMLRPLEARRLPGGARSRHVAIDGVPVAVGESLVVTIDPALQALAQKTAACYTGRHDVCRSLAIARAADGTRPLGGPLLEGAMVRMAAIAVVDVASGRIEALAGALSPCARQEVDGPGRDPGCDERLPYPVQYRPDALLNPAVFQDAMPASTIKPIMAATFLADRDRGARLLDAERAAATRRDAPSRDSLRGQLMRSDSARFLDRMFCLDDDAAHCRRPWDVQATAAAFGWNAGCAAAAADCGRHDLLFGRIAADAASPLDPASLPRALVSYGRLMSEPASGPRGAAMRLRPPARLDAAIVRRCAAGADGRRSSDDDWEKCKGGAVVDVVAEGWGQGHARASALGEAGMMATLAAAANGQAERPSPHLVEAMPGVAVPTPGAGEPHGIAREVAEVIMSGLSYSHRSGTARSACEQVFDARRCRDIAWLAGKTGTPSFPSDGISLDALARLCAGATRPSKGPCGTLRPHKWYVAAWRDGGATSGPWTKAIAVLTERNWLRDGGHVHGAGDHGPNPAAEIAMQIVGRQVGVIAGAAQ